MRKIHSYQGAYSKSKKESAHTILPTGTRAMRITRRVKRRTRAAHGRRRRQSRFGRLPFSRSPFSIMNCCCASRSAKRCFPTSSMCCSSRFQAGFLFYSLWPPVQKAPRRCASRPFACSRSLPCSFGGILLQAVLHLLHGPVRHVPVGGGDDAQLFWRGRELGTKELPHRAVVLRAARGVLLCVPRAYLAPGCRRFFLALRRRWRACCATALRCWACSSRIRAL